MDDGKGTVILISKETMEAAGPGFHTEQTGQFKVKGRKQAVEVYRLIDTSDHKDAT